jgi:hypothetical protein
MLYIYKWLKVLLVLLSIEYGKDHIDYRHKSSNWNSDAKQHSTHFFEFGYKFELLDKEIFALNKKSLF